MAGCDDTVSGSVSDFVKKTSIQRSVKRIDGMYSLGQCERQIITAFVSHHQYLPAWCDIDFVSCVQLDEQIFTISVLVPTDHLSVCRRWCNSTNEELMRELLLNAVESVPLKVLNHQEEMSKAIFI